MLGAAAREAARNAAAWIGSLEPELPRGFDLFGRFRRISFFTPASAGDQLGNGA
jgi:hypothetical protein